VHLIEGARRVLLDRDAAEAVGSRGRLSQKRSCSLRTWIANWNEQPTAYVWHKSAEKILETRASYCQRINDSGD
jgi:hypothetical protein